MCSGISGIFDLTGTESSVWYAGGLWCLSVGVGVLDREGWIVNIEALRVGIPEALSSGIKCSIFKSKFFLGFGGSWLFLIILSGILVRNFYRGSERLF